VTACFAFFAAAANVDEASIRVIAVTIDRVPARNKIVTQPRWRICRRIMADRLLA
jgi:hypothetical protein